MERPRLPKDRRNAHTRLDNGLQIRVILGRDPCPTGAPESCELGPLEFEITRTIEKFNIFRVGSGPTAFNEIDTKSIEALRNLQLIVDAERNAFPLGTVP